MGDALRLLPVIVRNWLRTRAQLQLEILALRHQLTVLQREQNRRPRLTSFDRIFWVWLYRLRPGRLDALAIMQPATVVRWHRKGFRKYWTWTSRVRGPGRPAVSLEIRNLVRRMSREAFPWDTGPRHLIRGRDGIYGATFRATVAAMGIEDVVTAPRSPWQTPYVERVIGSIGRECLNHVIVLNERHLRWILSSYLDYYHRSRTHLSLGKDCPEPRPERPPDPGKIVAFPQVGGLHHRYERLAA